MKTKNRIKAFLGILTITAFLILPFLVFARADDSIDPSVEGTQNAGTLGKLESIGGKSGFATDISLPSALGVVVRSALGLLGILFVLLLIVGGYKWMTAGGDEKEVETAINYIKRSIIGLVVILASWAVWFFIAQRLL